MRHVYDNNLVCSCGRTYENHKKIDLVSEKISDRWQGGIVDIENDFKSIEEALTAITKRND